MLFGNFDLNFWIERLGSWEDDVDEEDGRHPLGSSKSHKEWKGKPMIVSELLIEDKEGARVSDQDVLQRKGNEPLRESLQEPTG
jgi:hypothetical protein